MNIQSQYNGVISYIEIKEEDTWNEYSISI